MADLSNTDTVMEFFGYTLSLHCIAFRIGMVIFNSPLK
jgi:hypothetical protein